MPESDFYLTKPELNNFIDFVLKRISNTDINELIKRQDFGSAWFALKNIKPEVSEDIRKKILKSENGILKIASVTCGWSRSTAKKGPYRTLSIETLREFLKVEDGKSNEDIVTDIKAALQKSNDQELNEIVKEGLKNTRDRII